MKFYSKEQFVFRLFLVLMVSGIFVFSSCKKDDEAPVLVPTIASFSPEEGLGGDEVIIKGTNFSAIPNENKVSFNGTAATVTAATASQLTTTIPEGATSGKVTVVVNGQTGTSSENFIVMGTPLIVSFSPESGLEGTTITITGENFRTTATDNIVKFNDTPATVTAATATKLTVTVPEGATTGKLTVSVGGEMANSADDFTVLYPPTISSFSPDRGIEGDEIIITGENFNATASENTVEFSEIKATVTEASATSLTVLVPSKASTGKISVTVNEQATTSTDDFTVLLVKQMAAGNKHTLILKSDNTLWATGYNGFGQLGDGTHNSVNTPKQIMEGVKAVAAGYGHTMILKEDNTLWATGDNDYGQLGDGTTSDVTTPKQILEDVKAVSVGYFYTVILKENNTLWATGNNDYGQLGDGTTTEASTPKQIMASVTAIATGGRHTLILKEDNTLWGVGDNARGQLGDGTFSRVTAPKQIMEDVGAVSAGALHSLILKEDNTVWVTGFNGWGQLGDGTNVNVTTPKQVMENVKAITAGSSHSLALREDNTLWGMGGNSYGQLGDGTNSSTKLPKQIMEGVKTLAAGYEHTLIFKEDNTLWATGSNGSGQLGDGTTTDASTPVQISF